jgi:hypothetical protein
MTARNWTLARALDPTPPEGRDWLTEELQGPDYQSSWLESAIRALVEQLRDLFDGADQLLNNVLSPVITVLVALLVIGLMAWAIPRVRRESVARPDGAVIEDPRTTSRMYRDLAAEALREGRYDDAVLNGFRAIAKDTSDRTLLDDAPGRTAHEVSLALAPRFPDHAHGLARAADLFDSVRYGHRRSTQEQALYVQQLDMELVRSRPALTAPMTQNLPV